MKQINKKLPIYKQSWVLTDNFKEIGIKCVYNHRNRSVCLSLLNAPLFVYGAPGAQMTLVGCFKPFSDVRDNLHTYAYRYKKMYRIVYSNNPEMLKYLNGNLHKSDMNNKDNKNQSLINAIDGLIGELKIVKNHILNNDLQIASQYTDCIVTESEALRDKIEEYDDEN